MTPIPFRHPGRWPVGIWPLLLLIQGLGSWLLLWGHTPRFYPDSPDFLNFFAQGWPAFLTSNRTPGYPLVLQFMNLWGEGSRALPGLQFLLHLGAVVAFYAGLVRFGFRPLTACVAASPLLYTNLIRIFGPAVQSDAPGTSFAILTLAALLVVVADPTRPWRWVALGGALLTTYQVRPALLFLVALVVVLAPLLWLMRRALFPPATPGSGMGGVMRLTGGVLMVAALPLLLFFALRWAVVGHFGLVSYGGVQITGITSPLITAEMIPRLPPRVQPLARGILEGRQHHDLADPFSDLGWIRYGPWARNRDFITDEIAHPLARRLTGDDRVLTNQLMAELARSVIRERPLAYAGWVLSAASDAVCVTLRHEHLLALLVLLTAGGALLRVVRPATYRSPRGAPVPDRWETGVTLVLGLGFYGAGTLLVVLVEAPLERFMFSTATLLPSWLAVALLQSLRPGPAEPPPSPPTTGSPGEAP